jgi:hypothetical protein
MVEQVQNLTFEFGNGTFKIEGIGYETTPEGVLIPVVDFRGANAITNQTLSEFSQDQIRQLITATYLLMIDFKRELDAARSNNPIVPG